MEPDIERELGLSSLQPAHAPAHPGHQALPRELGQIGANGDFRDRKLVRKFRNMNAVLGLE